MGGAGEGMLELSHCYLFLRKLNLAKMGEVNFVRLKSSDLAKKKKPVEISENLSNTDR